MLQGFAESIGAIFNGLVDRIDSISYAGICSMSFVTSYQRCPRLYVEYTVQFRVNIPAMCSKIFAF